MSKTTILMLSGGIHSLYGLIDLLRHGDDAIQAHHVRLIARGKQPQEAAKSCQRIIDYCNRHYREFRFSQSLLDYGDFSIDRIELACVAFEAGLAVQSYLNDELPPHRCIFARAAESDANQVPAQRIEDCYNAAAYPGSPPALQWVDVNQDMIADLVPEVLRQQLIPSPMRRHD